MLMSKKKDASIKARGRREAELGILRFAVRQSSSKSYFQFNLTKKKAIFGQSLLKQLIPSQIHLIIYAENVIFQYEKI